MVRLRGIYADLKSELMQGFQFQYGAIKSLFPILNRHALLLFQFQYGAIKRNEIHE